MFCHEMRLVLVVRLGCFSLWFLLEGVEASCWAVFLQSSIKSMGETV